MYIDSYQVSYPYEKIRPGKRLSPRSFDFRLDRSPDYSVTIIDVTWIDDQGTHTTPLDKNLVDRAEQDGMTDVQTITDLRGFLDL